MDKKDFTRKFAKRTRSTHASAADQVDGVINDLLRRLRAGKPACLPGLGTLLPRTETESKAPQERTRKAPQ